MTKIWPVGSDRRPFMRNHQPSLGGTKRKTGGKTKRTFFEQVVGETRDLRHIEVTTALGRGEWKDRSTNQAQPAWRSPEIPPFSRKNRKKEGMVGRDGRGTQHRGKKKKELARDVKECTLRWGKRWLLKESNQRRGKGLTFDTRITVGDNKAALQTKQSLHQWSHKGRGARENERTTLGGPPTSR